MWQLIVMTIMFAIAVIGFMVKSGNIDNINQLKSYVWWAVAVLLSSMWLGFYILGRLMEQLTKGIN